jgi:hypothetical protein
MALFNTVHFPASVLELGTVKRPLVTCFVLYRCLSELCANCLNRQFGTFNTSIPLTKTNSDAVNLSLTLSQEGLTCMLLTLSVCVHLSAIHSALFWTNCNCPMSFFALHDHTAGQFQSGRHGCQEGRNHGQTFPILATIKYVLTIKACHLGLHPAG